MLAAGTLSRRRRQIILAYLREHIHRAVNPAELAREVQLSEDYFRCTFTKTYGQSPRSWITDERIRLAGIQLLEQPNSAIAEIAQTVGYADAASFSRQFKKSLGESPLVWHRGNLSRTGA